MLISDTNAHNTHTIPTGIIRFAANGVTDREPNTDSAGGESSASTIPWKIRNKYYTADVHFHTITVDKYLSGRDGFCGVPAVLFVWNRGQVSSQPLPLSQLASLRGAHYVYASSFRCFNGVGLQGAS